MPADPIRKAHIAKDATSTLVLPRRRVLVVAFHDWERPTLRTPYARGTVPKIDPDKRWECLQNPSGRLLLGKPYVQKLKPGDPKYHGEKKKPPRAKYVGPLVKFLRNNAKYTKTTTAANEALQPVVIDWVFDTVTVTWNIGKDRGRKDNPGSKMVNFCEYDVIVGVGLGVYNPEYKRINLEYGANPNCDGNDVNRTPGAENLAAIWPKPTDPSLKLSGIGDRMSSFVSIGTSRIDQVVDERTGDTNEDAFPSTILNTIAAGYNVFVVPARPKNAYVCNNTHYIALGYLENSLTDLVIGTHSRLRQVFFLHIPYASEAGDPTSSSWDPDNWSSDSDYTNLANAVGALIHELVSF